MQIELKTKVEKQEETSNVRYFKTRYETSRGNKVLLTYNTLGNFVSEQFIINEIHRLNTDKFIKINDTEEITFEEYNELFLKSLQDA